MQDMETYLEELDGELIIKQEYLDKLNELRELKNKVDKELKTLSSSICEEIKNHCGETTKLGSYNYVVKGGYLDYQLDEEFLREHYPHIYLGCLKPHIVEKSTQLVSATRTKKNV